MTRVIDLKPCAPVLKWVGGKAGLMHRISPRLPRGYKHRRHIEPFMGGGAVFFHHVPKRALLSDANARLMRMYTGLRNDVEGVLRALVALARVHDRERYYAAIARFNQGIEDDIEAAATFIYLSRTCFNGNYRENYSGEFNTSIGDTPRSGIVAPVRLREAARALVGVEIRSGDFEPVVGEARGGDFVFLDPPYVPLQLGAAPSFVKYVAGGFGDEQHVRLAAACRDADRRGALFMQSNSDMPRVRELYAGFRIEAITAPRAISAAFAGKELTAPEVLIRNY
jgi:DNA adenine methylase